MNQLLGNGVFLKRSKNINGTIQQDRAFGNFIWPGEADADPTGLHYNSGEPAIAITRK